MVMIEQVLAGILSTLAMTVFTEIAFALMKRPYHVVRILGNMLQFNHATGIASFPPRPVLLAANFIHYGIGIIFTITYDLFVAGHRESLLTETLAYGVFIGVLAIIGWRLFFRLHPGPPPVALRPYLFTIALGHIVLSLAAYGLLKLYDPMIS